MTAPKPNHVIAPPSALPGIKPRFALIAATVMLLSPLAMPQALGGGETFVETFDNGSNVGQWTWGTGNQFINPINGNPGPYLRDNTLQSCCPAATTSFNVDSVYVGNYREMNVTSVGIDLVTNFASSGVDGRPLTLMLINDNGTPFNFADDWGAYFVGPVNIPFPGVLSGGPQGWTSYDFQVPSQSDSTPEGWVLFRFDGEPIDFTWNDIITDVSVLRFNYGDPSMIFPFLGWDVGMDNPRITTEPTATPGDLNGDGVVNVFDLLILLEDWGECGDPDDCPADLNDDGTVNVFDLLILLENWG